MFRQAVVLTGGIATGKSTAAAILSLLGFRIIDADKIAREILENEESSVKELFGDRYIDIDGNIMKSLPLALYFVTLIHALL